METEFFVSSSCVQGYWLSTNSIGKPSLLLFPGCSPRRSLISMPYQAETYIKMLWLCVSDQNLSCHSSIPKALGLLPLLQLLSCENGQITKHQFKIQSLCEASNMEVLQLIRGGCYKLGRIIVGGKRTETQKSDHLHYRERELEPPFCSSVLHNFRHIKMQLKWSIFV